MNNASHGDRNDVRRQICGAGVQEALLRSQKDMDMMWPRARDLFYSLLFIAMAINLGIETHWSLKTGLAGHAVIYAFGCASAVISVVRHAMQTYR